jgi:NCS1 family nucleobase:cation symporter-1
MTITTSIFFLGWLSQILGLSLIQTIVAATIGNIVVAIIMTLNGYVDIKYGIPFPVQLRYTFGYKGSIVPLLVRVIVSIFWYGVDGYIAAWAITEMAMLIAGVPVEIIVTEGLKYTPITFVLYLIFVWGVGMKKIKGIKYLDSIAGPLLLVFFAWFVWHLTTVFPGKAIPMWESQVGWFSSNFFLAVAVQTAWWGTIALNVSDICRYNKKMSSLPIGHIFGLVVPQIVGTYLGFVATYLTGGVFSPIDIIAKYTPVPALGFFGLLFATLATGSTNVTGDVPAAANGVIRLIYVSWEKAVTIATFLAWLVIGPYSILYWAQALDVANYLLLFNWYYSMWLGPIAGVMVVDFWIFRRGRILLKELYNPDGIYKYTSGFNIFGLAAFLLGIIGEYVISAAQGTLQIYFGFLPVPGIELAWYYGFFIAAVFQLIFGFAFRSYTMPELKLMVEGAKELTKEAIAKLVAPLNLGLRYLVR